MRRGELLIVAVLMLILVGVFVGGVADERKRERAVGEQAAVLQVAARNFCAQNNGVFAASLDDTTASGVTLRSLMPQDGVYKNPFTGEMVGPVDGKAETMGQVGYEPCYQDGKIIGCSITAWGRRHEIDIQPPAPMHVLLI